jgi:hypothetical protein
VRKSFNLGGVTLEICTDARRGWAWEIHAGRTCIGAAPFVGPRLTRAAAYTEGLAAAAAWAHAVLDGVRRAQGEA